jgi:hypothetical protein
MPRKFKPLLDGDGKPIPDQEVIFQGEAPNPAQAAKEKKFIEDRKAPPIPPVKKPA